MEAHPLGWGAAGPWEGSMPDMTQRIEAMHKRDVTIAWAFIIGLWFSIIFVAFAT